jgi:hypothetical protein
MVVTILKDVLTLLLNVMITTLVLLILVILKLDAVMMFMSVNLLMLVTLLAAINCTAACLRKYNVMIPTHVLLTHVILIVLNTLLVNMKTLNVTIITLAPKIAAVPNLDVYMLIFHLNALPLINVTNLTAILMKVV